MTEGFFCGPIYLEFCRILVCLLCPGFSRFFSLRTFCIFFISLTVVSMISMVSSAPEILFGFGFFWGGVHDRVSLCSPSCPRTHFVDQAGLELRNLSASASQMQGLQACTTMPGSEILLRFITVS